MLPLYGADTPILGTKVSRLVADSRGRVLFAPMFHRRPVGTFHRHDRAVCAYYGNHGAPWGPCTCGFYAVHTFDELHRFAPVSPNAVVLDVALGGKIVEHEYGYRAGEQAVLSIALPDRCARCGIGAPTGFRLCGVNGFERELQPVCGTCERRSARWRRMTIADVAAQTGCGITAARSRISQYWPTPPRRRTAVCAAIGSGLAGGAVAAPTLGGGYAVLVAALTAGGVLLGTTRLSMFRRLQIGAVLHHVATGLRQVCTWRRYTGSRPTR